MTSSSKLSHGNPYGDALADPNKENCFNSLKLGIGVSTALLAKIIMPAESIQGLQDKCLWQIKTRDLTHSSGLGRDISIKMMFHELA